MLQELNIKNIALIRELSVSFGEGLNVLSGETGAGKSIIVDSVSLILGARADKELIKHGEDKAYAEALVSLPDSAPFFDFLQEHGIEAEGDIIVSRELSTTGKNVCRINGRMVPLTVLREVMARLINLHGQDASREVMVASNQLGMLDSFIGQEADELLNRVGQDFSHYNSIKKQLDVLNSQSADKLRTLDMLSYQIKEIEEAALLPNEEDELTASRNIMQNAEKIAENLYAAHEDINGGGGVMERLHDALNKLQAACEVDESLSDALNVLTDAYYNIEDAADTISKKADGMTFSPEELERTEDRIAKIRSLKRKYGADEQAVLDYLEEIKAKFDELNNMEYRVDELEKSLKKAKNALDKSCAELTAARKKGADRLSELIDAELRELGMSAARFSVELLPVKPSKTGCDDAEFFVSLNVGEPPKPLVKVASGGEASRIMLAFKGIMATRQEVGTLIFDEIDTGISGRMATVVAQKMAKIARERQVICVSHLPQIAAMADDNFLIEKSVDDRGSKTELKKLDARLKSEEVARLTGGDATQTALAHAGELIAQCDEFKKNL